MNTIGAITKHGYTIEFGYDDDPENPRDWDNLAVFLCRHRRYNLGDKDAKAKLDGVDPKANKHIVVPLYLYDHSGITISTKPFSCPWDSGQVGVAVVTYEAMRKEYGVKRVTNAVRAKALAQLEQEVRTYDQFLRGVVLQYRILDPEGEVQDSMGGIYQDAQWDSPGSYAMSEAMATVEHHAAKREQWKLAESAAEVWP